MWAQAAWAVAFFLSINFASKEGLGWKVYGLPIWHHSAHGDIEQIVDVMGDVAIVVTDDFVGNGNKEHQSELPLSVRSRTYRFSDHLFCIGKQFGLNQGVLRKNGVTTKRMLAGLGYDAIAGGSISFPVFSIERLESCPNGEGRGLPKILDRGPGSECKTFFCELRRMDQFYVFNGQPCSSIGIEGFPRNSVRIGRNSFAASPLLLTGAVQQDGRTNKQKSEQGDSARKYHQPPVGRRLILAVIGLLGCFICGLRYSYEERRGLAAVWLACAILLGSIGMGLWWMTGFRETWNWPI